MRGVPKVYGQLVYKVNGTTSGMLFCLNACILYTAIHISLKFHMHRIQRKFQLCFSTIYPVLKGVHNFYHPSYI